MSLPPERPPMADPLPDDALLEDLGRLSDRVFHGGDVTEAESATALLDQITARVQESTREQVELFWNELCGIITCAHAVPGPREPHAQLLNARLLEIWRRLDSLLSDKQRQPPTQ